jgi:hypothetical protein
MPTVLMPGVGVVKFDDSLTGDDLNSEVAKADSYFKRQTLGPLNPSLSAEHPELYDKGERSMAGVRSDTQPDTPATPPLAKKYAPGEDAVTEHLNSLVKINPEARTLLSIPVDANYSPQLRAELKTLQFVPPPGVAQHDFTSSDIQDIADRVKAEHETLFNKAAEPLRTPLINFRPEWTADELESLKTAPKSIQRMAGIADTIGGAANFLTTAEGAATLPLFAAGGVPGALARVGFGGMMVKDILSAKDELGKELGKPKDGQDHFKIGQLESQIGLNALMVGGIGGRELTPHIKAAVMARGIAGAPINMPSVEQSAAFESPTAIIREDAVNPVTQPISPEPTREIANPESEAIPGATAQILTEAKDKALSGAGSTPSESPLTPKTVTASQAEPVEVTASAGPSASGETSEKPNISPVGQDPIGPIGMGGAVPSEFEVSNRTPTSTKNAVVDAERVQMGLPPVMKELARDFGTVKEQVDALIDINPDYQDQLIKSLQERPRATTDAENYALLQRQADLRNEYAKAARSWAQAYDDKRMEAAASENLRMNYFSDKIKEVYDVGQRAGTETGRGLNARKMMMKEDFSLASMELRKRAVNGGKPLTAEQRIDLTKQQKQIELLQRQVEELQAKAKPLADIQKPGRSKASSTIIVTAQRFVSTLDRRAAAARKRLLERGTRFSAGLDPTVLLDLADIGAAHIAHIGLDLAKWSAKMIEDFGEGIKPHLNDIYAKSQDVIESMKPEKRVTPLDSAAFKAQAELERAKNNFDRGLARDQLANRSGPEKVRDFFIKWGREFKLSSPTSILKLTAAATTGMVVEPFLKEPVGAVVAKALPEFRKRLRTESPSSIAIEAKVFAQTFSHLMDDFAKTIKTSQGSDIDAVFGRNKTPEEMQAYMGRLHAALKTPLKRAEFTRVLEKQARDQAAAGVDITDPLVQTRMGVIAYKEANRMLFLEDNKLVDAYGRFLSGLEQKDPVTGHTPALGVATGGIVRFLLPIVRIPTNIIARTIQAAVGFPVGATKLAMAYAKGIKELPEEQADLIMRQLKAGSVGGAVLLLGYFYADKAGGYYQAGDNKKKGLLEPGSVKSPVKIPEILGGPNLSKSVLHHPILETFQLGATIKRVEESKLNKKDKEAQGLGAGAMAGLLGLTMEVPFARETIDLSKLEDPHQRGKFGKSFVAQSVEPQLLQWLARQTDKRNGEVIKRDPKTFAEQLKVGVPGLREQVKEKK